MDTKIVGPFTVDLKVHVVGEGGAAFGAVKVGLAPGQIPTIEAIHRAIGQALAAIPDGFTLQNPDDFFGTLVQEKAGRRMRFATPGNFDYELSALEAAARAAYVPENAPKADESEDHDEEDEDFWGEDA